MKPFISTTGLLVTQDVRLMDTMNHVMNILDVHTTVCMDIDKALRAIEKKHYSCVVLDWQSSNDSDKVLHALRNSQLNKDAFTLALVKKNRDFEAALKATANMVCYKSEAYKQSLKYLKPGREQAPQQRREGVRHSVQWKAQISNVAGQNNEALIIDISNGGIALQTKMQVKKDDTVKVSFAVPGDGYRAIIATSRVKRCTPEGEIGLQFSFIPAQQKTMLEKWLASDLFNQMNTVQTNKRFDQFSKVA